jgi:hypothetical protein
MSRLTRLATSLRTQPGYTLMRGAARFSLVREAVARSQRFLHRLEVRDRLERFEARLPESMFPGLDRHGFVDELRERGVAFGLTLPPEIIAEIRAFAASQPCYADRNPARGFWLDDRPVAERLLGKPILVAQYFNTVSCPAVDRLCRDPLLQAVAHDYLQAVPAFVGANLWWTFPVKPLESDRSEHAHLFHRDVDDFRFFKYFFYLTDVVPGEGAHVVVANSHRRPPVIKASDRWNLRRFTDDEIHAQFPTGDILEVCGKAGSGFAENTLCVHKGRTPTTSPRLLLQLQYALFDYGVAHDDRRIQDLRMLS